MDISAFRGKYPQYNGTEDAVLADALFAKYYEGKIDRQEFEVKFLGAPIKSDSLLGAEHGDWAITKGAKSLARGAIDAIKGDAEFPKMGNINSIGAGNNTGVAMASMFGDDEDYAKAFKKEHPDAIEKKDKNGNVYFELAESKSGRPIYSDTDGNKYSEKTVTLPIGDKWVTFPSVDSNGGSMSEDQVMDYIKSNGPVDPITGEEFPLFDTVDEATTYAQERSDSRINRVYLNKPGLDGEDITRFVGKTLSFAGAGAAGALTKGAGLLGRMAAVGGASAVTDAAMQKAAGRDEIDGGQVVLTGALGAGAEAIAPAIGAIVGKVRSKYSQYQWKKMSDVAQRRVIARQLTKDGFSPDDLRGMSRQDLNNLGAARVAGDELVSPDATIAQSEFGYKLTRGDMMPDGTPTQRAGKFSQLADEERLRSTESGQRFRDLDADNALQTDTNIRELTNKLGGAQADTAMEGAEQVHSGVLQAERAAKSNVDDAYNVARGFDAEIQEDAILAIPSRVNEALRTSSTTLDDELTPGAAKVLNDLTDNPVTTIKDLDIQRQRINNIFSDTMDRRDKRALKIIKDSFDDSIGDAIDQKLFTGDPEALDALKNARALYADYAKKFRSNDEAGKVVQKMVDFETTPEQVSQYMVGINGLSKAGAARIAKRYGDIVGRDSEAFNALRETAFLTITRKPTGESKGAQALVSTLKKAMKGQGSSLMKELYSVEEMATIKRFTIALESTMKNGDFAKSSGTAERMLRFYNSGGFRNLPFVDTVKGVLENHGVNQALLPPARLAKPISLAAPVNATVSSQ
ncbi:hypothetical protein [uncultured Paraglaciecola sp.]|uniref:hypothetical protein n=1 Tax=uncultured Paraglaciecola sp. TaxID=1765024 RepID=UPI002609F3AF|nr:hypothetical protein [uncultured Paraglaciecola sp.]